MVWTILQKKTRLFLVFWQDCQLVKVLITLGDFDATIAQKKKEISIFWEIVMNELLFLHRPKESYLPKADTNEIKSLVHYKMDNIIHKLPRPQILKVR